MIKATWKDQVIAESGNTVIVEGNYYFPIQDVNEEFLTESDLQTTCPWKGKASYYSINVEGEVNKDSAWYYPEPSEAAKQIRGHVAFWKGVEVVED